MRIVFGDSYRTIIVSDIVIATGAERRTIGVASPTADPRRSDAITFQARGEGSGHRRGETERSKPSRCFVYTGTNQWYAALIKIIRSNRLETRDVRIHIFVVEPKIRWFRQYFGKFTKMCLRPLNSRSSSWRGLLVIHNIERVFGRLRLTSITYVLVHCLYWS